MKAVGCEKIIVDTASGVKAKRPVASGPLVEAGATEPWLGESVTGKILPENQGASPPKPDVCRLMNSAKKRLGIPMANMETTARIAAALLGQKPPESKPERINILQMFCSRFPTKVHAAEALANARVDAGFRPPAGAGAKRRAKAASALAAKIPFAVTDAFLWSFPWRRLRMVVLTKRGSRCECCGKTPSDGIKINVDHIKPRRKYPELALTESNLQVLCEVCNHGKGSWDETDWRPETRTTQGMLEDSPVPGTVTATERVSALSPRLVRRS